MSPLSITPEAARQMMASGALLVDIRDADEYARQSIPGALPVPLAQLTPDRLAAQAASTVIFHCRSGQRTRINAEQLSRCGGGDCHILEGGLDAWMRAGLPISTDASQPLELSRQVHIAAGSLVLSGVALGATLSPWFYALAAFVGAGLTFSGVTGFCGMARLLMVMPWNRPESVH